MSSRTSSDFGTLGERTAAGPRRAPASPDEHVSPAAPQGVPAETGTATAQPGAVPNQLTATDTVRVVQPRHVWIDEGHAGLLVAWRHTASGWQGRVFWCPPELGEAALDWMPQHRLRPRD